MSWPGRSGRLLGALLLLAVPVVAHLLLTFELDRYAEEVTPYRRGSEPVLVAIPSGARAVQAVDALVAAGVLRSRGAGLRLLERSGRARSIQAGEYRFERPLAPAAVLDRLLEGEVFLRRITIPEGLNRFEVAERFARAGFGEAASFLEASANGALVADFDSDARDLEGYLFPETYRLGQNDGAEDLVAQMVTRFREVAGADAPERAAAIGLTLREVVTLASLVEKETSRAEERPIVAGVYRTRLQRGMLLQADPTVIYGLVREGRWGGDLKRAHLREAHPYNTYVRPGLPPGPIASPGRASIEAALGPVPTEFLYFVSRNDGSHEFSRTLSEHNRQVAVWQRAYWRERWRREGGRTGAPSR